MTYATVKSLPVYNIWMQTRLWIKPYMFFWGVKTEVECQNKWSHCCKVDSALLDDAIPQTWNSFTSLQAQITGDYIQAILVKLIVTPSNEKDNMIYTHAKCKNAAPVSLQMTRSYIFHSKIAWYFRTDI